MNITLKTKIHEGQGEEGEEQQFSVRAESGRVFPAVCPPFLKRSDMGTVRKKVIELFTEEIKAKGLDNFLIRNNPIDEKDVSSYGIDDIFEIKEKVRVPSGVQIQLESESIDNTTDEKKEVVNSFSEVVLPLEKSLT